MQYFEKTANAYATLIEMQVQATSEFDVILLLSSRSRGCCTFGGDFVLKDMLKI